MAFAMMGAAVAPKRACARATQQQQPKPAAVGRRDAAKLAAAALGLALSARPAQALPKKARVGDASNG